MNLNAFAKEVHALAVEKGFYDPAPSDAELIAAIHSEVSEAFEEWRAGRPMVYHRCGKSEPCKEGACRSWKEGMCLDIDDFRDPKPEGIAVELIDVALRVLDAAAAWGETLKEWDFNSTESYMDQIYAKIIQRRTVPELVCELHRDITEILHKRERDVGSESLATVMSRPLDLIFTWLYVNVFDPEALLLEKHAYNRTRPYRHGGKRV